MKKLTADSHFVIGYNHISAGNPCQDYALSGVLNNSAFAIVSDGCSSGGMTDIGSRIIALTTARAIKGCVQLSEKFGPEQITLVRGDGIKQAGLILGLVPTDMLATCLYAYVEPQRGFIHLEGDGVIAFKSKNGEIKIHRFDWADNTPFYPAYLDNLSGFIQTHGGDPKANRITKQTWALKPGESFVEIGREEITLENGIRGTTILLSEADLIDLEFISIFTDGVNQVDKMDWKEAVLELFGFKTTGGVFAKRRMIRFVQDSAKRGKGPCDDISFAVINLKQDDE